MELENEVINNLETEKNDNSFFNTFIGQTVNSAIDVGLRTILPDLIENQIIDVKNALIENGLIGGIRSAVDSTVEMAKSAAGIVTGNFQNMDQVKMAVEKGGIIDTVSSILDKVIDKANQYNMINDTITNVIKSGKNVLLNNIANNIENQIEQQESTIEVLKNSVKNWNTYYEQQDFEGMEVKNKKIEEKIKEIVPLENILKETRRVENIHNLIKNNGNNFNITEEEIAVANKLI